MEENCDIHETLHNSHLRDLLRIRQLPSPRVQLQRVREYSCNFFDLSQPISYQVAGSYHCTLMSIARAAQFARLSALQLPLRSGSFIHSVIHLRSLKHHRDSAHIWVMRRGQALQSSGTSTCTSNMTGHSVYVVTGASRGLGFEFVEQVR